MNALMTSHEASLGAARVMQRCDQLSHISETPGQLTRVYLSPEHLRANALVAQWMNDAGMLTWQDAVGNICGRYEGATEGASAVLLGSHLDTVRNAGRYDGMLGVISAIELVDWLNRHNLRLAQAIEIVGFADEEGTRFGVTLLGSRGLTGSWPAGWLEERDAQGVTVAQALVNAGFDPARIGEAARNAADFSAYLELHIEQGPVLERENLALGVVTAINGAKRLACRFTGEAGHAGTVPMSHRRDALAASAEWMVFIEQTTRSWGPELVATVGTLGCEPGAVNVIPGAVNLTLDIRSPSDAQLETLLARLLEEAEQIAIRRGLTFSQDTYYAIPATLCDPTLQEMLAGALEATQGQALRLPSGAGHDAIAIAERWPVGMLFVRCAGGVSHHPAEAVQETDVALALVALSQTVTTLAQHASPLARFNGASEEDAAAMISPCVALPHWTASLVRGRPYASPGHLLDEADALARGWSLDDLNLALSAHPRIGEKARGESKEAALSRGEQAAVNARDAALADALAAGNAAYEARFGRVFLIRASGRSGEEILSELARRMENDAEQEAAEALDQLRQITLLRLEGALHP